MAIQVYSGTVAGGGNQAAGSLGLPARSQALGVTILAQYSATAATTGVKLQVAASIDGGLTYSNYTDLVTAAPPASSGVAVQAEAYASLDTYKDATNLEFNLVNLDGTNTATVTVKFRAAE